MVEIIGEAKEGKHKPGHMEPAPIPERAKKPYPTSESELTL